MLKIKSDYFAAIASFRAKNDIRFYLNSVLIETGPNGAYLVATDGSAIAVARINSAAMPESQVLICSDIAAMLAKQKNAVFVVTMPEQTGKFNAENGKRKISIETLAHTGASTMVIEESEGVFPDWRRVARHEVSDQVAFFAPMYVQRVDDAARLIKGTTKGTPAGYLRPGGKGCGFATLDNDGLACAWVMPMRQTLADMPSAPAFIV